MIFIGADHCCQSVFYFMSVHSKEISDPNLFLNYQKKRRKKKEETNKIIGGSERARARV